MIKFILGTMFGGSLGFIWAALLQDDRPEVIVRPETDAVVVPRRLAFAPADNFLRDCPQVCGNCRHWEKELYAWGNVQVCRVCGRPKNCGQICDVYAKD